jgi:uncharacterized protein (TIGR02117 family)
MKNCLWLVALSFPLAGACAALHGRPPAPSPDTPSRVIYVVSHGWHTGIVLRRRDVSRGHWPETADFSDAEHIEVGWGARDFYRASDPGPWLAFKAAVWPAPGVLHVVGFRGSVSAYFPASEVVVLNVSVPGFDRLSEWIGASHERDANGRPVPLGPGLYGQGRFYASHDQFHLFRTCNVWTAQALVAAGVNVSPDQSLTADSLLSQLRALREGAVPATP